MPDPTRKHPPLKLTKSYIDKVTPGPADELHWDTEVKGFGARCTPTGKLTFIVQGRTDPKKPAARITIGPYGVFTVDQARDVAREHLRSMRMGVDPREVKKQQEAERQQKVTEGVTLKQVYDSYVSRPGALKPSTRKWYEFYVTKVFADWQDKPVVAVTRDMVKEKHAQLARDGLPGKKVKGGAPASANSAMVVLRILLNYAADEHQLADGSPLISTNPVAAMKRHWAPAGDRTDRYVSFDRVGAVWNALHDARITARNGDIFAGINFVLFLMVTGARRSEVASLRWSDVCIDRDDPAKSYWFADDRKQGKPTRFPLSTAAVAILDACKRVDGNDHIFPSRGKGGHIVDPRGALELVDKVAGRIVGAHGLRKTFSNISQRECRIEKFRTDLLIGHKPDQSDVTSRAYLDLTDLRWLQPEVEAIGAWIEQKGAVNAGANVVPLVQRA
ncbi:tyrosine-type recombinase/integrase [Tabrizicola fusiformis]|uniref:tyrosine-type recombinase/integrase n=1 Tax=Tabrizicola sp. SY72 TaxID=2741673 RepID=UPI0015726182|nr:integrase family protein [Tabrizicola sp. SY72]NTT85739.1 integrase family protein [Tabrizicola sp. SY72]